MLPIETDRYPWINRTLIESVLKSSKNSNTNLIDYEIHDAVGKGENYCSHMMRISVNYSDESDRQPKVTNFVIKTTLAKEIHDKLESLSLFAREVAFYRDILPKFRQYTILIDPEYKCSPRCFQVSDDPLYIMFEDLRQDKYHNLDRIVGLNFKANEMLLLKLAKFHAVGCMVYDHNPELFVHHRKNPINIESTDILSGYTIGMRQIQEVCAHWPGYEHYAVKLGNLVEVILERVSNTFEHDPNEFNTLTHGDLWINNLMYKLDDAYQPADILMVDYQVGRYGSPTIDLSYLFFTSSSNELYEEDWDRLIQIYHAELVKSLKTVKYEKKIPTLTELHVAFLKCSIYSVMVAFTQVAPRNMTDTSMADVETLMKDPVEYRTITFEIYHRPEVMGRVKYLLDYFARKGFLDV